MTTVEWLDTRLNIRRVKHGSITWLDVFSPGTAEMEYLRQTYQFHPLALEDCLSRVQLPKLDDYDDYLFLILQFPRFRSETRLSRPVDVDVFVSGDYVITVHFGELRPLAKLFSDCESSEVVRNDVMGHNTGALFYRILADLVAYMFPVLTKTSNWWMNWRPTSSVGAAPWRCPGGSRSSAERSCPTGASCAHR